MTGTKLTPVNIRSANIPNKPGAKLRNGAILLAETVIRIYEHRRDSIVLAVNPLGFQPFVTWHRVVTTDSPLATGGYEIVDTCALGYYHSGLDDALKDYEERWQKHSSKLDPDDGEELPR